jgi:hypothetical protein
VLSVLDALMLKGKPSGINAPNTGSTLEALRTQVD